MSDIDQRREALVPVLIAKLQERRLRTRELLRAANVIDRRVGEDTVWMLVKRGRVVIGPDSTLRLRDEKTR